jgi:hypothetical protein
MASPRFSLGSSSVVTEGSEAAKSLCISEETVEFSCALSSRETVSLCASPFWRLNTMATRLRVCLADSGQSDEFAIPVLTTVIVVSPRLLAAPVRSMPGPGASKLCARVMSPTRVWPVRGWCVPAVCGD